jgi:hypothetical protein
MTTVLHDLWHDLREKRLWPVAAALLAAMALVPLVLLKGASHEGVTGPTATPAGVAAALPVVSIADGKSQVSKLDAFAQKNPFKSMADPTATAGSSGSSSSSGGTSTSGGSSTGSGGSAGAGTSTTGGSSGGSTGGGTGGTGTTTPNQQLYALHVDVRFGTPGHVKSYKDLKPVSMLPDTKNPVVIFMGMRDFKTAIFMIDSSKYKADGEGKCQPSGNTCDVLTLKVDQSSNEETLAADDGTQYTLKLTGVRKVPLSDSQTNTANGLPSSNTTPTKTTPKAKAAATDAPATGGRANDPQQTDLAPLFDLPLFAAQG